MEGSRARRYAAAARSAARGAGRVSGRAAGATGRAARRTAEAASKAGRATGRSIHRATSAQGAGESGLANLIELHAVNAAGDVLIAISLAGTLFFSVPVGEARGQVALYLLITMAPFAVMAPLIGPLLDRVRSGRRYAIATTMLVRAFLAWQMAGSVTGSGQPADLWLYPAAFGVLVASKSYIVTRSATVPRLLPPSVTLVRANSRISLAGIIAGGVAAALGGGLAFVGPQWSLRAAFVVFLVGMVLAIRLPARVDSSEGEQTRLRPEGGGFVVSPAAWLRDLGAAVITGLGCNGALRAFSGFLTMFLAFLLRQDPIGGLSDVQAIGLVAGAAGAGGFVGTTLGALLRARGPEVILVAVLTLETLVVLAAVIWYGLPAVLAAGFVAGFAQTLGKLSLDAQIQRDVGEHVRTSAFARSETVLQLSWVLGGAIGISLPLRGDLGLGVALTGLVVALVLVLRSWQKVRVARRSARDYSESDSGTAYGDSAHSSDAQTDAAPDPLPPRRWYEA